VSHGAFGLLDKDRRNRGGGGLRGSLHGGGFHDPDGWENGGLGSGRSLDGFFRSLGLVFQNAPDPMDLVVGEIGAMALALDAQALLECVENFVIAHAKLFC
jgi:hypothetical protein